MEKVDAHDMLKNNVQEARIYMRNNGHPYEMSMCRDLPRKPQPHAVQEGVSHWPFSFVFCMVYQIHDTK